MLLRAINITKSYAGAQALKDASFELRAGEVHALVGENGAGKSTLIKIITGAIGADARVLIMDEPTASLSEEDTQNLFNVIRRLRSRGVGVIYISHRLEELPLIADRVTVLRDGATIDTRSMAEVSRQELIRLMVGRELSAVFPKRAVELGETALELRNLGCRAAGVHDVSLTVRAGEIVGLAGLV